MVKRRGNSLLLLPAALCLHADSSRISRKRVASHQPSTTKLLAGITVLNYDLAFGGGEAGSAAAEENWVVVVQGTATDAELQRLCSVSKNACRFVGHPSSGGVPFLELRGTEEDLRNVLAQGGADFVRFAEPALEVRLEPDVPEVEAPSWGLERIGAPLRETTGKGVHVHVLDTGIRTSHQDFGGRAVPLLDMTSDRLVECSGTGDPSCAGDGRGHGTHCAGTVAGQSYGVAPAAVVSAVKVLSDEGSGSWAWSYAALDWLAARGPRPAVASMSLGGSGTQHAMRTAVTAAVEAGVVVVVAAGNSNSNACNFSPAFVPAAITVGSTTSEDERSPFSNFANCVNIWAPGSSILSAGVGSDSDTKTASGTSMACPHVSGAVALALEVEPAWSSEQVLAHLLEGAVLNGISGLRDADTNALLYVGAGGPPPTPEPVPTPAPPPEICDSAYSSGPNQDGDCRCLGTTMCYENGKLKCPYYITAEYGLTSKFRFTPACAGCMCK